MMIVDEVLGIVREPHLIISSDRTEFQSFDGLPSHRRNVFPVNLEPIIEHCSVFPRLLNIVPPPSDLEHHHLTAESHSCGDRHNHYYLSSFIPASNIYAWHRAQVKICWQGQGHWGHDLLDFPGHNGASGSQPSGRHWLTMQAEARLPLLVAAQDLS